MLTLHCKGSLWACYCSNGLYFLLHCVNWDKQSITHRNIPAMVCVVIICMHVHVHVHVHCIQARGFWLLACVPMQLQVLCNMTFKEYWFLHTCRFHVQKITYKRKRFYIELRSENGSRQPNTVGFHMDSYDGCKQLWKSCIEYNAFFRWGYKTVAVLTGSGMVEYGRVVTHTYVCLQVPFSWQLGKGPCYNMCKTIVRAYHISEQITTKWTILTCISSSPLPHRVSSEVRAPPPARTYSFLRRPTFLREQMEPEPRENALERSKSLRVFRLVAMQPQIAFVSVTTCSHTHPFDSCIDHHDSPN